MNTKIELCIVIPTFNECLNIEPLVTKLNNSLNSLCWEVIFVDDNSPDKTYEKVISISESNPHVRIIRRIKRRGLSSAVIEGMLATSAPYIAVMDADLQHDESILRKMYDLLNKDNLDLAVGSRMTDGGDLNSMSPIRKFISKFCNILTRGLFKTEVQDIMSGFFMIRREKIHGIASDLSLIGFKILADIIASSKSSLKIIEVPYTFKDRLFGESKLDSQIAIDFIVLILDKKLGRFFPARFLPFILVGFTGLFVHLLTLKLLLSQFLIEFKLAQSIAVLVAILSNYTLNNLITYRDLRNKGINWFKGLLSFVLISGIGAIGNVGVASILYQESFDWKISAIAGILVGVIWNFSMSRLYTWRK